MSRRRLAVIALSLPAAGWVLAAHAADTQVADGAVRAYHGSARRLQALSRLPDWSGVWERFNVGPSGGPSEPRELAGFLAALQELSEVPYNAEWAARYAAARAKAGAVLHTACDPGNGATADFLNSMVNPPMMMLPLLTPEGVGFQFYNGNVRYVRTDGKAHPPRDERWPTPAGDAVGRWEGDTLVIDTVAAQVAFFGEPPMPLSGEAHYVERMRRTGADTLDYEVTIEDPVALGRPWVIRFQYHRVPTLREIPYAACDPANERNPVVDGKFTIAPPAAK